LKALLLLSKGFTFSSFESDFEPNCPQLIISYCVFLAYSELNGGVRHTWFLKEGQDYSEEKTANT